MVKQVRLNVVSTAECKLKLGKANLLAMKEVTDDTFCAGGEKGFDTCSVSTGYIVCFSPCTCGSHCGDRGGGMDMREMTVPIRLSQMTASNFRLQSTSVIEVKD